MLGVPTAVVNIVRIVITFHLVLLAWVFFRASSFWDAMFILKHIASDLGGSLYLGASQLQTVVSAFFVLLLIVIQVLQSRGRISLYNSPSGVGKYTRMAGYVLLVFGILIFGISSNAFIYFQF
jgi:hypothetical protein